MDTFCAFCGAYWECEHAGKVPVTVAGPDWEPPADAVDVEITDLPPLGVEKYLEREEDMQTFRKRTVYGW